MTTWPGGFAAGEEGKSSLQPGNCQAAVYHHDLSGAEGEVAAGKGGDGLADVFGDAPARLNAESAGDQLVVFFRHAGGHVGLDDAGADFVNGDPVGAEARREELREHAQAGLRNAVFTAVDRDDRRGDRCDVDDRAAECGIGFLRSDHVAREGLREEEHAAQVRADHMVIGFFRRLQKVGPNFRRDAGVVDQKKVAGSE